MTKRSRLFNLVGSLAAMVIVGCGTSGSRPTAPPEVRFRVHPSGTAKFSAQMVVGGVTHSFPAGTVFTASSDFDFYFEGSTPQYGGTFTLAPDSPGDIEVILTVTGQTDQTVFANAANPQAVVGTITAGRAPTQELRYQVCVAFPGSTSCSLPNDPGQFGLPISATLGDPLTTYLSFGTAPSIYYLEGAADSAHAVFALQPLTGQTLVAQFFMNGNLVQTQSGTGDVIISQNL